MLTVSKEQMLAIRREMDGAYKKQLSSHLRIREPDLFSRFDNTTLEHRIGSAVAAMRSYGPISDEGMMKFAVMVIFAGERMVSDDAVNAFLRMPGYTLDAKVSWLMERTMEKLRGPGFSGD